MANRIVHPSEVTRFVLDAAKRVRDEAEAKGASPQQARDQANSILANALHFVMAD